MIAAWVAAVLATAFAFVVGGRWRRSGRPAFAAWSAGLLIFAAAAGVQAAGQQWGWSDADFRLFYLLGGVLGVAYLGLGSLHLLAPRRVAVWATWVLLAITAVMAVDAVIEPVDTTALGTPAGILGGALVHAWPPLRIGALVLNIAGTVVLVGGSAWSAWRLWRDRAGLDRVVCNVLLTAGALVIASGFSAAKVQGGSLDTLGVLEAVGIAVMFAGFLSLGRVRWGQARRSTLPSPPAAVS